MRDKSSSNKKIVPIISTYYFQLTIGATGSIAELTVQDI